ncbi:MAG: hypothetical protein EOP84_03665 [Verrucomicrobiaceae bacterium]|nr:MAG: hypothetical protein EOP84_03665 [Verrucomicrobiaceae bacterium]
MSRCFTTDPIQVLDRFEICLGSHHHATVYMTLSSALIIEDPQKADKVARQMIEAGVRIEDVED